MKSVTIKEIAQQLNLSVSTVSRALSNSYEISEATKEKVRTLAQSLNYRPNPHATGLRMHKSGTIAVIIPEISNNFFALVIDGIEEVVQDAGYQLLVYLSHENSAKERAIINKLQGRADGVLVCMATESNDVSHIKALKEQGIPVVFFDRVSEKINAVKVVTNDFESAYQATEHLIQNGAQRIAYLSLSLNVSVDQKRMHGFLKAAENHKLKQEQRLIVSCSGSDEENLLTIKKTLSSPQRPDAIFACVEKLTIPTYVACNELGLRIPEDVKVLTFSNLATATLLKPSLTTVSQPAYQIGKEAAKVLVEALKKNSVELGNERIVLPSTLIERESTQGRIS